MSDISSCFETAVTHSEKLSRRPANDTLLKLYAYYKQATSGDVQGERPGFTDPKGHAKHDAWATLAGTSAEQAMESHIALVERLRSR
jgi:acyl-CoA-binding protein